MRLKKSFMATLTLVTMFGCNPKENLPLKGIEVPNQEQLTQSTFADQSATPSVVQFNTTGAWISSISETTVVRSSGEAETVPNWISVSPSSGDKAGSYSMSISLAANLTGKVRSAQISLYSEGQTVFINVTQEPKTADGKLPMEAIKGSGTLTSTNGQTANVVSATHVINAPRSVRISFISPTEGTNKGEEFLVDMNNALADGRLAAGTYVAGEGQGARFNWIKSSLGNYSQSGSIVVARSGENYTFTIDFTTDDSKHITGSYTGQLLFLNTEVKVSEVRVDQQRVELEINRSITLNATVVPTNALNKKITWASSDSTVAKVNQSGLVQTLKAGTATITAISEDGGHKGSCLIVVAGVSITGNGSFKHTGTNQEINLSKVVHSVSGYRNVILDFYSSANNSNFQLSFFAALSNGRLPAGSYSYGRSSAQDNTFNISKSVLGGNPISGTAVVTISGDRYDVALDIQLETDKTGLGGKIIGNYSGTFDYPSPFVPVSSINLNKTVLELERGNQEALVATILPANASHKVVKWSSSDSNVASVSSTGLVYAYSVGTATITALTEEGNRTATCVVTVTAPQQTGSETFTYTLGGNIVETFTAVRVVKDSNGNSIRFYDANQQEGVYFQFTTSSGTLEDGTYQWNSMTSAPLRWYSQKGTFGKTNYYCEGVNDPGTIIVNKSGNDYTITLNWNVTEGGASGTIKGTYSGTIK